MLTYRRLYYLAAARLGTARFGDDEAGAIGGGLNRNEYAQRFFLSDVTVKTRCSVPRTDYMRCVKCYELNGCYNGSEKFGPDYRFKFFPSASLGSDYHRGAIHEEHQEICRYV